MLNRFYLNPKQKQFAQDLGVGLLLFGAVYVALWLVLAVTP